MHCGFCTATCPTYVLLGDELDSPRGRIYLIKEMLEHDRPATGEVVKHIDRCLSCLSCMTTCPSGVHYMHLVDHARVHIEETYRRPLPDRALRALLAFVMPYPARFRAALRAASLAKPLAPLFTALGLDRLAAMVKLAPTRLAPRGPRAGTVFRAEGARRGRVAILRNCANEALAPKINDAAIRLLTRHGVEVVLPAGEGCCGGLVHHMGKEHAALAQVRANVDAWTREIESDGLDAILVTASGCGTTIKDYGFMLRTDPAYAEKAARVSSLAKDVTEYVAGLDHRAARADRPHGRLPRRLLAPARPEGHARAQGLAGAGRFPGQGCARGAPVLRLGRHLQHAAARDRAAPCRAQGRQYRAPFPRRDRDRQPRLHDPDRRRDRDTGHAQRRAFGLGDGRAYARGACRRERLAGRASRGSNNAQPATRDMSADVSV